MIGHHDEAVQEGICPGRGSGRAWRSGVSAVESALEEAFAAWVTAVTAKVRVWCGCGLWA